MAMVVAKGGIFEQKTDGLCMDVLRLPSGNYLLDD
jgi:hypothetical protein